MKCTSFLYRAISLLLWMTSCSCLPSFAALCPRWFTKSSETRCSSSIYGGIFIPNIALWLVYFLCWFKYLHVSFGDHTGCGIPYTWKHFLSFIITLHSRLILCHWRGVEMAWQHLFQESPWDEIRTMRSSNHTAKGYLILKNALCHSLKSYILNWSIVMEQNRFQNGMTSFFWICRLLPTPPQPLGQKCIMNCVTRLCTTLYYRICYIQGVPGGMCQTSGGCSLC